MKPIAKRILVTVIVAPVITLLWLLADGTRPYLHSAAPVEVEVPEDLPREPRRVRRGC